MARAKVKGKSFLNDKCPTVLMRSGETAQDVPRVV